MSDLTGLPVVLSRVAEDGLLIDGGRTLVLPQHSVEAEAVIAAELVACTLGQRSRPELVDRTWKRGRLAERLLRFSELWHRAVAAGAR